VLDAVNRQDERGFEYFNRVIASTGLTLDNTVRCDKGRSAFKGSNLKEDAALRKILDEIAAGTIASGSILIVENLDRISRQGPNLVRQVLARVTDNGVEIHILNINQMLKKNWENDFGQSVVVDNELQRAWKESLYKSDRIGRAWKAKKDNAAGSVSLTARLLKSQKKSPWFKGFIVSPVSASESR
jgi:DNA invertase Pin-like site-specific DNA recombinase